MCSFAHLAQVRDGSGYSFGRDLGGPEELGREPLDIAIALSERDIVLDESFGESCAGTKLRSRGSNAVEEAEFVTEMFAGGAARVILPPPAGSESSNLGLDLSLGLGFGDDGDGRDACSGTGNSDTCSEGGSVLLLALARFSGRVAGG